MKYWEPRILFGFGILLVITILALIIALGNVKQDTSYGLEIVLGSLATLSGGFAQWAFSKKDKPE
jgi:hypothetical protein